MKQGKKLPKYIPAETESKRPNSVPQSKQKLGKYIPSNIEAKWQSVWEEQGIYRFELRKDTENYYTLVELPYPSGDLHLGHWFAFVPPDAHARYSRMSGKNTFFPNGFDAFGLPAENAAIKRGIHPQDWTLKNIETMKKQFGSMGTMIDWSHEAITCLPEYYTWNQWIFLKMYEKGIAYRGKILSNWCPVDQTVLANEHVEDGKCWRCGSVVEQKEVEQWFLKITEYADKLLWKQDQPSGCSSQLSDAGQSASQSTGQQKTDYWNGVDWPQSVREGQNNWIGRSEGAEIAFPLKKKYTVVILHGFGGNPKEGFYPWLRRSLEEMGHTVEQLALPNTDNPTEEAQVSFVLENHTFDENTILYGHSLGSIVAMKVVEKLETPIAGLILSGTFKEPKFKDNPRPFEDTFDFTFDQDKIVKNTGFIHVLHDKHDRAVFEEQAQQIADMLGVPLEVVEAEAPHFGSKEEPELLNRIAPSITVFTTRPDTLYGATFLVLAPEHELVVKLLAESRSKNKPRLNRGQELSKVREYVDRAKKKTELERKEQKEKTGVFTGLYALHPLTKEEIPIWVADYVLWGYGTGAIMAVPGHDERDFAFAKKFDLPIKEVIQPLESRSKNQPRLNRGQEARKIPYAGSGTLVNSGDWDGWQVPEDIAKVIASLESARLGKEKTTYHLHDWSISRQRYWGTPVPIIYCINCWEGKSEKSKVKSEYGRDYTEIDGVKHELIAVPLDQLPVTLPYKVDYTPKGKPPLASAEEWMEVLCPSCGGKATRDPETLDTFFDSSWYYYRYLDPRYTKLPFDTDLAKKLMPVDIYFGGAEHTLGHTLYARFFTKFFKDIGLVAFDEFAKKRVQHGIILGPDGQRMSKSRGNVVNPDDVVKEYGTDTVRVYLCFMMPYIDTVAPWNPSAIAGIYRFLRRIWDLQSSVVGYRLSDSSRSDSQSIGPRYDRGQQKPEKSEAENGKRTTDYGNLSKKDLYMMHTTIKKVGEDLANIKFNTAIASMMEWLNFLSAKESVSLEEYKTLLLLLAPFAPHMTEELWQSHESTPIKSESRIKNQESKDHKNDHQSIHLHSWPEYDKKYLVSDTVTIAVQVNGKLRGSLEVDSSESENQELVEKKAKEIENIVKYLAGNTVRNVIYIKGKILNFVVS